MVPSPGIIQHPIARMKMKLRPVESELNVLQSESVKTAIGAVWDRLISKSQKKINFDLEI